MITVMLFSYLFQGPHVDVGSSIYPDLRRRRKQVRLKFLQAAETKAFPRKTVDRDIG